MPRTLRTAESVWDKVDQSAGPDACWPWRGSVDTNGYGQHWHDGRLWMVHRDAYTTAVAPLGDGLTIDHLCYNKLCCNPSHLEAVPLRVNMYRRRKVTHCPQGHEYTEANTYVRKFNVTKVCRACVNAARRRRRAERKAGTPPRPVGMPKGTKLPDPADRYRPQSAQDGGVGCPGQLS